MPNNNRPLLEQITQSPLLINGASEGLFQASIQHVINGEHAAAMLDDALTIQAQAVRAQASPATSRPKNASIGRGRWNT